MTSSAVSQDDVVGGDHAEIAVAGFRGMDEERRRAGGGKSGRDLAADMARFAEPGDDQPSLGVADAIDGRRKRRAEVGLQRRRDRGNAASLNIERAQGRLDGGVGVIGAG
jgi:hypothetical protein